MPELDDIKTALNLPHLSPSAPYEIRETARLKAQARTDAGYPTNWWELYPEGHVAAAIFRVWKIIGQPGWEIKDSELPDLSAADKAGKE